MTNNTIAALTDLLRSVVTHLNEDLPGIALTRAETALDLLTSPRAAGLPEGWKLVPIEPTDEMLRAIRNQRSGGRIGKGDRADWSAWLDAAPAAPVAELSEGCTPADAEMLRSANHGLADENDRLRRALAPFARLVSTDRLSWAIVEYRVEGDPEKQTFRRPQMQRAFNRAADLLGEDLCCVCEDLEAECNCGAAQAVDADGLSPEEIQDRLHRFNSKRNTTALTVVSVTEFVLELLAERAAVSPATATIETVTMLHKWDETGERCVRCGDKDWMGTTCTTMKPQAPATADELAAFLVWWTRDVPEELRRDWINRNEQFLREGKACEALARAWEGWQARASQAAAPTIGMDRSQFHDKAWALWHEKALADAKLPKLSIYAIRTLWDVLFDSMPAAAPAEAREPVAYTSRARLQKLASNPEHVETMWGVGLISKTGNVALYDGPVSVPADAGEAALTAAARDVLAERARQVNEEGFTPDRDDRYTAGQLAQAGAAYAIAVADYTNPLINSGAAFYTRSPDIWPWSEKWWKPSSPRRALVKAAALAIAEIERIDRAEAAQGAQGGKGGDRG
ncbi:hypothetical protein [Burkholderia gladioli]|uniref:hypothetical protein n=1 Tax=Burkholderia gladioli TaxID=28095 RepID=UPI0034DACA15